MKKESPGSTDETPPSDMLSNQNSQDLKHKPNSTEMVDDVVVTSSKKSQRYTISKVLGGGAFGKVFLASKDDKEIAIKQIRCEDISDANNAFKECILAKSLNHNNVAKYLDAYIEMDSDTIKVCIEIEYCSQGTLSDLIKSKKLTEDELMGFARGILEGIEYIHSQGVIHRDLKPQNLLLKSSTVKITDFGLSKAIDGSGHHTSVGTHFYCSPEVMAKEKYSFPADIFSFGAILYFCVKRAEGVPLYMLLMKDKEKFQSHINEMVLTAGFSDFVGGLIKKCCTLDPIDRPTASNLIEMLNKRKYRKARRFWLCVGERVVCYDGNVLGEVILPQYTIVKEISQVNNSLVHAKGLSYIKLNDVEQYQLLPDDAVLYRNPNMYHRGVVIRKTPSLEGTALGVLDPGAIVQMIEMSTNPDDLWARHHKGWSRMFYISEKFCEPMENPHQVVSGQELFVFSENKVNSKQLGTVRKDCTFSVQLEDGPWVKHKSGWSFRQEGGIDLLKKSTSHWEIVVHKNLGSRTRRHVGCNQITELPAGTILEVIEDGSDGSWFKHSRGWTRRHVSQEVLRLVKKTSVRSYLKTKELIDAFYKSNGHNIKPNKATVDQITKICVRTSVEDLSHSSLPLPAMICLLATISARFEVKYEAILVLGAHDAFFIGVLAQLHYPSRVVVYETNPDEIKAVSSGFGNDEWLATLMKAGHITFVKDIPLNDLFKYVIVVPGFQHTLVTNKTISCTTPGTIILSTKYLHDSNQHMLESRSVITAKDSEFGLSTRLSTEKFMLWK